MFIPAFWAGVLCTLFSEMIVFFLFMIIYVAKNMSKTHENTSKNDRSD